MSSPEILASIAGLVIGYLVIFKIMPATSKQQSAVDDYKIIEPKK